MEGFNPCALLILVFFIFFLLVSSLNRAEVMLLGGFFILSSLITNFFLGFGLLANFRGMELFFIISKSLYLFLALLAVVVGSVNFYDWVIYRKTFDVKKFILKIPRLTLTDNDPNSAARKEAYGYINLILGAGILGFVVVLFQSGSRGQVFLPAIVAMISSPELKNQTIFFMLLYSVMFVLPLWIAFQILLVAFKSPKLIEWMNRHVSKIKIISSAIFLGLGLGLLRIFTS